MNCGQSAGAAVRIDVATTDARRRARVRFMRDPQISVSLLPKFGINGPHAVACAVEVVRRVLRGELEACNGLIRSLSSLEGTLNRGEKIFRERRVLLKVGERDPSAEWTA